MVVKKSLKESIKKYGNYKYLIVVLALLYIFAIRISEKISYSYLSWAMFVSNLINNFALNNTSHKNNTMTNHVIRNGSF